MAPDSLPRDKHLLTALPAAAWQRWQPLLDQVDWPAAALQVSADHADGAHRRVRLPPLAGPATMPLAAAEPGPARS